MPCGNIKKIGVVCIDVDPFHITADQHRDKFKNIFFIYIKILCMIFGVILRQITALLKYNSLIVKYWKISRYIS